MIHIYNEIVSVYIMPGMCGESKDRRGCGIRQDGQICKERKKRNESDESNQAFRVGRYMYCDGIRSGRMLLQWRDGVYRRKKDHKDIPCPV